MTTATEPRWCPSCGKPLFPGANFCPNCGAQVFADGSFIPPGGAGFGAQGPASTGVHAPVARPEAVPWAVVPAPTGSRRLWIVLGIVIFIAIVAAAGALALISSGAIAPHHDITGTLDLVNSASAPNTIQQTGSGCQGDGGYDDIRTGAQVTLRDGAGVVLATSQLGSGSGSNLSCVFMFTISNVPEVPFYSVEISHRGGVTASLTDMRAAGWTFSLTLGK